MNEGIIAEITGDSDKMLLLLLAVLLIREGNKSSPLVYALLYIMLF